MFKTYLKFALKNLVRNRLYSLINVGGLSIALACCLIITLYVKHELTYDSHFVNAQRIYRVHTVDAAPTGERIVSQSTSMLVGSLLRQDFPGIESATRVSQLPGQVQLQRGDFRSVEPNVFSADENVFELFDVRWLAGSPENALVDPLSIVLTRSLAEKYFGTAEPLGQTLTLENRTELRVSGVIEDLPGNTHLQFAALLPTALQVMNSQAQNINLETWQIRSTWTYILAEVGTGIDSIQRNLDAFAGRHLPQEREGSSIDGFAAMALTDIHLQSLQGPNRAPAGSTVQILSFSAIALCILLVAVINFVNLTTAISSRRAVEIGMRKAVGAYRSQIVTHFLADAFLMSVLSMVLAIVLAELALPAINQVIGMNLALAGLMSFDAVFLLLAFTVVLGVLAGGYPAFYLSAFKPVTVLRGDLTSGKKGVALRNLLVVLQFSVAIVLIVSTVVLTAQTQFSRNMDLGFNEQQVVEIALPPPNEFDLESGWQSLRAELLAGPGIVDVTHGISSPLRNAGSMTSLIAQSGVDGNVRAGYMSVDTDYFAVFEVPLLAGRLLSSERAEDALAPFDPERPATFRGNVVLNETAARQLGWSPAQAIGQELSLGENGGFGVVRVAGVVSDTVESARRETNPLMFYDAEGEGLGTFFGSIAVRLSGTDVPAALAHIDRVWATLLPEEVINRRFMDEQIEALYQAERRQLDLLRWFSLVAIAIACFGLFGLATQNTESRTKEIGVRKVMGGSVWSIVLLLTNTFSKLVLVSNLIAWPVAYIAMSRWLENFAYRIDLTPLIFIGSGLIALCIAWVTVGGTAAKAAAQKPVLALRYE